MATQEELITIGLKKALEYPQGLELLNRRGVPGAFSNSPPGKQAGQLALSQGLIAKHGYSPVPARQMICITPKGVEWVVDAMGIAKLLEQAASFLAQSQACSSTSMNPDSPWQRSAKALAEILPPPVQSHSTRIASERILVFLKLWAEEGRVGDCPLPTLFRHVQQAALDVTLGEFHDILRSHRAAKLLELHPWTGPLYELPDPAIALMVGHEICYYACLGESLQTGLQSTDGAPFREITRKGIYHEPNACQ